MIKENRNINDLGAWRWLILLPLVFVGILWLSDTVRTSFFLMEVPHVRQLPFLESSWTYAYLHMFTFIPVFLLSFDRNVHYYRKWKYLLPSILIVGSLFIAWDVFFTIQGVWGFNKSYLSGVFVFHLPLEECLFFVTVPFACVFIYECLNYYVKRDLLARYEPYITVSLMLVSLVVGGLYWGRMYTATTFLLTGAFLLFHLLFLQKAYLSRFYLTFLVSLLPFLLVNGVLTGGYTQQPVVFYNPEEYLGIRITSIPLEDSIYGFLLLLGVVTVYEFFREEK